MTSYMRARSLLLHASAACLFLTGCERHPTVVTEPPQEVWVRFAPDIPIVDLEEDGQPLVSDAPGGGRRYSGVFRWAGKVSVPPHASDWWGLRWRTGDDAPTSRRFDLLEQATKDTSARPWRRARETREE